MDLDVFNTTNEKIKEIISRYQQTAILSLEELQNVHNTLIFCLKSEDFFEDFEILLKNALNEIKGGNIDEYLIKNANSYHTLLWKLHQRILNLTTQINPDSILELKAFNNILATKKLFLKDPKQDDVYFCVCYLGNAEGHISTLRISPTRLDFEYNDHCPARTEILKRRLMKYRWRCEETNTLKNIFSKTEVNNNYFFKASKDRMFWGYEDLIQLAT
jgi:hypothetical protein